MTVNTGFAGGKFVASWTRKFADCRKFLSDHGLDLPVMVDGNVSFANIPPMVGAGTDILVTGTSSWFYRSAVGRERQEDRAGDCRWTAAEGTEGHWCPGTSWNTIAATSAPVPGSGFGKTAGIRDLILAMGRCRNMKLTDFHGPSPIRRGRCSIPNASYG